MRKIIIYAFLLIVSFGVGSCKKYLDINKNPNAATEVTPGLLFNYAAASFAGNRTGGDFYIPLGLMGQTLASGGNYGWGAENIYDVSIYTTGNTWKMYYATSGNNLKEAIAIAESSEPVNHAAAAQCKILLAEMAYEATMLWGDVPFTEAWQAATIPYPKFDNQESVLNGVLALLDEAIGQIPEEDPQAITDADLFYKGDLGKWKRLAHAMKFRILMTMVDKDPSKASEIGALLSGGQLLSGAGDNFAFPFSTVAGRQNPKYRILESFAGGSNIFFFANTLVTDPMKAQNDPRLPRYFDLPGEETTYNGVVTEQEANAATATISMYLYRPDAPELIFSYQEQLFLEAEAYARGIGVGADINMADEKYKQALTAACLFYGVSEGDAAAFAATKTLIGNTDAVREIHLQQWIDLMDRPFEAFNNWRRSGPEGNEVPVLSLPLGAPSGPLIRRWVYPNTEEISPNPNAPKNNPMYYEKLWFDL